MKRPPVAGARTPGAQTPATCKWAEPRVVSTLPLWLRGWRARWCCLHRGSDCVLTAEDCRDCPRWEPRTSATMDETAARAAADRTADEQ
jgi:hypothetical protein